MITFLKQGRFGMSDAVPTDDAWSSPIPPFVDRWRSGRIEADGSRDRLRDYAVRLAES